MIQQLQRALSMIYPDQCILCETRVEQGGGLCPSCWRETPFISGLACESCGASLPGTDTGAAFCDDCMAIPRPWEAGRAALSYTGVGRRIVLALKHGDRLDLVPACAEWLARAGKPVLGESTLLVPVPSHWTRLIVRRYNQAAELCRGLARVAKLEAIPDGLIRKVRTPKQDGMTVDQRFASVQGAITVNPKQSHRFNDADVCIVDDVMTSGATLSAATEALYDAGAERVCVLVLARVSKRP